MSRLIGFGKDGVTATDRRRIFRGTIHSFLIQGISIALVFASNWWLVRSTDTVSYGLYVQVFNWVSILSVLVMGGRDDLVLAQLPKYIAAGEESRVRRLIRAANGWVFGATLLIGAAFIGIISFIPIHSLSEHRSLFLIAVAAVYFSACLSLNQMILQALNHIRLSQIVEKITRPLLLIIFTGLFRLSAMQLDSRNLVVLGAVVSAFCCGIILTIIGLKMRACHAGPVSAIPEKHGSKTTYFFFISLLNLLSTKVTMLLLPLFAGDADVGIFNIAYRFADLLIFPFFLMHSVLPQLFARHSMTEKDYTRSLFNESTRLMTLIALPLLLLNILAGPFLLRLFGPAFVMGYKALVYISLAQFLFSFFGPANTILMMQGREKYSAYCLFVYVVVLIASSRLLLPSMGVTGGALAILISSFVYNGLLNVLTYRIYGICTPFLAFFRQRR
jgi:O-antigen/teichoic acid export membrane protein